MNARFAPLLLALVLTGCPETTLVCGVDMVRIADGGCGRDRRDTGVVQLDGGPDGGTDAGVVCEPACDGDTPHCVELAPGDTGCVGCRNSDDCGGGVCVNNECVQCEDSGDCDEATPICDSGTCRECVSAGGECAARDATTPVCMAGRCTQCSLADQNACTGAATCNLLTGECTGFSADDRGICQSCTNDTQCEGDARCVQLEFPVGTPHTAPGEEGSGYCLLPVPTLPSVCERPYMTIITRESLGDSTPQDYCGINEALTTCEAIHRLIDQVTCTALDSECGVGGVCRAFPGIGMRCTYRCADGVHNECLNRANEDTCRVGIGTDRFCGP